MRLGRKVWMYCMVILLLLLSGCGEKSMMEQYSFGQQQLQAGQSALTMMMPFQLAPQNSTNNVGQVIYAGNDAHVNFLIVAQPVEQSVNGQNRVLAPRELADHSLALLKRTASVKNLKSTINNTMIGDISAVDTSFEYEESANNKTAHLVVRGLYFTDNDQVWNINYIYRADDAMGKEVVDYIWGKIQK